MEDEIKQPDKSEVLPPANAQEEESLPPNLLEYLESDRGHEIAKTILGLWKELQQVTIGSKAEQHKDELKRNHEAWRQLGIMMQTALAMVVIGSAVALAWHSKMDATITGFLGVALGYVLGQKTS